MALERCPLEISGSSGLDGCVGGLGAQQFLGAPAVDATARRSHEAWAPTVDAHNLVAKGVVVGVIVTFSCDPMPPIPEGWRGYWEERSLNVEVRQATAKGIAWGEGGWYFPADELCDSQPHEATFGIVADASGSAFKSGSAAIAASIRVDWHMYTNDYPYEDASGSARDDTGWLPVKLRK